MVDDGSTDSTAEAVLEMLKLGEAEKLKISEGKPWPEFKLFRQENAGPGAARNRGLAEATGEFIHFFDSDDIAAPNKHEVQLRALVETGADIAYGPWVKGRFVNLTTEVNENTEEKAVQRLGKPCSAAFSSPSTSKLVRDSENTSSTRSEGANAYRFSDFKFQMLGFSAIGPVLQARGLPKGDLVRALLTNWSIVPHACLFRRSILEKAGGFPEDIWVGEDQLLFLRCFLAGAKAVHTPETMVFYRVGDDPGKLTATGAAQKRHSRDWGKFLLSAKKEIEDRRFKIGEVPAEAQRRGDFLTTIELGGKCEKEQPKVGSKCEGVGTNESKSTEGVQGDAQGTFAGAAFSNPSASELARDSENTSPSRCTRGHASYLPANIYSLKVAHRPSVWFGFRLRAFEAWRDLEKFFPHGEDELKNQLQGIWKGNWFSGFVFQVLGFVFRKLGGLKFRVIGYREHASFRCAEFSSFIDFGGQ